MEALESLNVEAFFGLDIVFVIDSTGSMMSYINGAKESIKEIMTQSQIRFKNLKAEENLLKFAVVAYRDHEPQDSTFVTKTQNFSSYSEIISFLDTLVASGGGDPPEAVLDGLNEAVNNLSWRDESEKMLFLLLDNPGHGIRFGTRYDCPCGLHESKILPEMKKKDICFHIIRPNESNLKLDNMINIFKEYIDIEILELEKYKRINIVYERKMDESLEFKIFNRGRFNSHSKDIKKNKHMSEISESSEENKMSICLSRSRSRSKEKEKLKIRNDIDIERSPHRETPKLSSRDLTKEYICEDVEMNIESGIKDHISKVVIDKLNRYLETNKYDMI